MKPLFAVENVSCFSVFSFQPFRRWAEKAGDVLSSLDNENLVDFDFVCLCLYHFLLSMN